MTRWRTEWRWPWADALPRRPERVFAGLAPMRDRLERGKLWAARFKGHTKGSRYDGSYESNARLPRSRAPHARRARRGRRK